MAKPLYKMTAQERYDWMRDAMRDHTRDARENPKRADFHKRQAAAIRSLRAQARRRHAVA